jgi:hypothetical protein
MSVSRSGRSFYRRFLPSKRRRRKSRRIDPRSPEDDSLVDAPAREDREREKHRDRRRYRDDEESVVVVREKIRENGHGRRERDRRYREEDEVSLVDSVDRNEGERIVRERVRSGDGDRDRYRVREKRREYYEKDVGD